MCSKGNNTSEAAQSHYLRDRTNRSKHQIVLFTELQVDFLNKLYLTTANHPSASSPRRCNHSKDMRFDSDTMMVSECEVADVNGLFAASNDYLSICSVQERDGSASKNAPCEPIRSNIRVRCFET